MKFFKQYDDTSCHLVAMQTILSFYEKYPSKAEIKKALPKHSFGNIIPELGLYLEQQGIKTTLVSNNAPVRKVNKLFLDEITRYKTVGKYQERPVILEDFAHGPVLVNVDWYKIKNEEAGKGGHYVVVLSDAGKLWLYDGSNYDSPVPTTMEEVIKASIDINRWKDNGLFLICGCDSKI